MSLIIPQIENNPLSGLSYVKIGRGVKLHLSTRNDESLCGKYVDLAYMDVADAGDTDICTRCYKAAEKRMKENRRIAYGVMRDQELDRMTYGGQPFTKEEETAAVADAMQYAGRTTNADIAILTADGFVECTPEILKSALTELVMPVKADYADPDAYESGIQNANDTAREEGFDVLSAEWRRVFEYSYEFMRVENETVRLNAEARALEDAKMDVCENCWGSLSDGGQHDAPCSVCNSDEHAACQHAELVSEEWHVYAMGEWRSMDYVGCAPVNILIDGTYREIEYRHHAGDCNNACVLGYEPLEDNSEETLIVEAHLSIEIDGIKVDLGWHTFYVPPLCEKSIASLYGEMHGEWKRPSEPDWDSIITVEESETY